MPFDVYISTDGVLTKVSASTSEDGARDLARVWQHDPDFFFAVITLPTYTYARVLHDYTQAFLRKLDTEPCEIPIASKFSEGVFPARAVRLRNGADLLRAGDVLVRSCGVVCETYRPIERLP